MDRLGSVDLNFDDAFEKQWWRLEKLFWIFAAIILACGVAGLFGRGPLSEASVSDQSGDLSVHYERFARFSTPNTLAVRARKGKFATETVSVHLNGSQLVEDRLQVVQPHPLYVRPDGKNGAYFTFDLPKGVEYADVLFTQQPATVGFFRSEVAVAGHPAVSFSQFVWP